MSNLLQTALLRPTAYLTCKPAFRLLALRQRARLMALGGMGTPPNCDLTHLEHRDSESAKSKRKERKNNLFISFKIRSVFLTSILCFPLVNISMGIQENSPQVGENNRINA